MGIPSDSLNLTPKRIKPWLTTTHYDIREPYYSEKPMPFAASALLRIMWRVIYKHFTKAEHEKKKFIPKTVTRDILRLFMSRVLAFQHNRRNFYLQRRFSSLPKVLPKKAVNRLAHLGKLNKRTGKFKIKPEIIEIFKEYEVWTDFDKEIKLNSYKAALSN